MLLVHGGGWERRSREDMAWIAEELAGHGFAVMNIDYRFAPEYTFPAQLQDMLVPPEQAEDFHNALLEKGVHSELYMRHLRGHITSFLTAGNAVEQATEFLVRFGRGGRQQ